MKMLLINSILICLGNLAYAGGLPNHQTSISKPELNCSSGHLDFGPQLSQITPKFQLRINQGHLEMNAGLYDTGEAFITSGIFKYTEQTRLASENINNVELKITKPQEGARVLQVELTHGVFEILLTDDSLVQEIVHQNGTAKIALSLNQTQAQLKINGYTIDGTCEISASLLNRFTKLSVEVLVLESGKVTLN